MDRSTPGYALPGFTRRTTADGVLLYPARGRQAGWLRVRPCVRPLRTVRQLRAHHLAQLGDGARISAVTPRVTDEGEHAVTYDVRSGPGGPAVRLHVGLVFVDDAYAAVEGFCADPAVDDELAARVRELTQTLALGAGTGRRRRYRYAPPPGWQALAKRHAVSWYPGDYPRNASVIRVFDAVAAVVSPGIEWARHLFDDIQNDLSAFTDVTLLPIRNAAGLRGAYEITRGMFADGAPAAVFRATLQDEAYAYSARLEAREPDLDRSREIFEALLASIELVPRPVASAPRASMAHWIE